MKILHLITSLDEGGAQRYLAAHCVAEQQNKHVVLYLTGRGHYCADIEQAGATVYSVHLSGFWDIFGAVQRLRKIVEAEAPDLILAWMYHAILLAHMARPQVPIIWNVRQTYSGWRSETWSTFLIVRFLRCLRSYRSACIYNSLRSKCVHELLGYGHEDAVVIHNGILPFSNDDAKVRKFVKDWNLANKCVVLNLARYHPMKGHRNLVMAMHSILQAHESVVLMMAGRGVDAARDSLLEGLEDDLRFRVVTFDHIDDVPTMLFASNVYVGSSVSGEAYPNAVAEAVAAGCYVVATDVGDTSLILHGNGVVVPPGDIKALSEAILAYIENENWSERRKVRQNEVLSFDHATEQYRLLYHQISKG